MSEYDMSEPKNTRFFTVVGTVFAIALVVSVLASLVVGVQDFVLEPGNVALIEITGVLTTQGVEPSIFTTGQLSSADYAGLIRRAAESDAIDAIVLRVNSPGGSPVGSHEVMSAVKDAAEKKPVVAYIRETGASGAYWVVSAADFVVAHELSITGSVGVMASYLEFSDLFEEYGIEYVRLAGGEYKDTGSPFRELTDEERVLIQGKIDIIHGIFFDDVVASRNLTQLDDEQLSMVHSGIFFTAPEAYEHLLIDEIGTFDRVEEILEERYGIDTVQYAPYRRLQPIFSPFGLAYRESLEFLGSAIGRSLGEVFSRDGTFAPELK